MVIGYARVSSQGQNLDRQIEELTAFGCDRIFTEKKSGKDFDRPEYQKLRRKSRFGDVLVVHDLSRFGRNKREILKEWQELIAEEIDIVVLNMPLLDTRDHKDGVGQLVGDLVLTLLSWMVEEERSRIRAAQREGIKLAKRKGKYKGGVKRFHAGATGRNGLVYKSIVEALSAGESVLDIHRQTGVARSTIYDIRQALQQ